MLWLERKGKNNLEKILLAYTKYTLLEAKNPIPNAVLVRWKQKEEAISKPSLEKKN